MLEKAACIALRWVRQYARLSHSCERKLSRVLVVLRDVSLSRCWIAESSTPFTMLRQEDEDTPSTQSLDSLEERIELAAINACYNTDIRDVPQADFTHPSDDDLALNAHASDTSPFHQSHDTSTISCPQESSASQTGSATLRAVTPTFQPQAPSSPPESAGSLPTSQISSLDLSAPLPETLS